MWDLEQEYRDWFAFVRSHTVRFGCCIRSWTQRLLDPLTGFDQPNLEDLFAVLPAELRKHHVGIFKSEPDGHCEGHRDNMTDCIVRKSKSQKFVNFNNCDNNTFAYLRNYLSHHYLENNG
eukprot:gnl/TRDRNA2_/TRDRNA2_153033_c0_seq3.p1 gnl/TRDRNA2_/TRDRNA2_153033_c0~~gnl/TRDRNA2_/TRDRNA2_153033_c0_seq3.p1  ORF type:complete len:120 (+),score=3.77 gnl/TRDRNA2_/TRDRNA2_153033_c0_seq3:360-719(+)